MRVVCLLTAVPLLASVAAAQQTQQGQTADQNKRAQSQQEQPSDQNNGAAQAQAQSQQIRQQIRKNLAQAGFSDIQLMPSSFLVRAKDKNGNSVMMVISPHSVASVTKVPRQGNSTTGQGGSNGQPRRGGGSSGTTEE